MQKNKNRSGYKKTKVGWIPEDWDAPKMEQVFGFKQGVQVPVEQQHAARADGLIRFIRIVDLTTDEEPPRFVLDPGATHHVEINDLFMVRYGRPGLVGRGQLPRRPTIQYSPRTIH